MMKIKQGFLLRSVGQEQVVIALGPAAHLLNGLIKLNDSGVLLWNLLVQGAEEETLVSALQDRYGITAEQAVKDVSAFVEVIRGVGCLE